MLTFNSLFEMRGKYGGESDAEALATFNSLFEMHSKWIIYAEARYAAFNSLFEMLTMKSTAPRRITILNFQFSI